jgi:hypothetical protein
MGFVEYVTDTRVWLPLAASAGSAFFTWWSRRDLQQQKSDADKKTGEALASQKRTHDEELKRIQALLDDEGKAKSESLRKAVEMELLAQAGSVEERVQKTVLRVKADIERELKVHESQLRVRGEVQLKLYEKELALFMEARGTMTIANDAYFRIISNQQHPAIRERTSGAIQLQQAARRACAIIPLPHRKPISDCLIFIGESLADIDAGLHGRSRQLVDDLTHSAEWERLGHLAVAAFEAFYEEIQARPLAPPAPPAA